MAKVERTHNYNGEALKPGEILVLTPYDENDVEANCTNKENIVTVRVAGRLFKSVLKAVPRQFEAVAKTQFNDWVNSQLPAQRDGRCMIPQTDGSFKECPRKNGTNHPSCKACPHRNEYEHKDKNVVSVESLEEEYGFTAAAVLSLEDDYINWESLSEAQIAFLHKIELLTAVSPKHALAMLLMAMGIKGTEFADKLQLGHDAANRVRQQVLDLAPNKIDDIGQIDVEILKSNQNVRSKYYREEAKKILDTVIKMYFNC